MEESQIGQKPHPISTKKKSTDEQTNLKILSIVRYKRIFIGMSEQIDIDAANFLMMEFTRQ